MRFQIGSYLLFILFEGPSPTFSFPQTLKLRGGKAIKLASAWHWTHFVDVKRNCGVAECDDHNRDDKVCAKENAAINASKRLTVPMFKATRKNIP